MRIQGWSAISALTLTMALLLGYSGPLAAQDLDFTGVGVFNTTGDDVTLYLAGVSAHPDKDGWMPVGSVQVYRIDFPIGIDQTDHNWSVTPAVGVRHQNSTRFIEGKVGYGFRTEDGADFPFAEGGEGGFKTSAHLEYWGTGPFSFSGIASYSFGSEFFWSRARASTALVNLDPGAIRGGLDVTFQGDTEDEDVIFGQEAGSDTNFQIGPVLQWNNGSGLVLGVGGGLRTNSATAELRGEDESTWYFKAEIVLY